MKVNGFNLELLSGLKVTFNIIFPEAITKFTQKFRENKILYPV